ncbi:MAG: SDR family NAD(P)-dependent oxidoreductase [Solirubrobacteraceae bacterium]|jgi:NAD(P)-dependent dehydrogenase (short-subunit alcohol dehydrogenase family)
MSTIDASQLLRPDLLHGVSVLLAGAPVAGAAGESLGASVRAACAGRGAHVCACEFSRDALLGQDEAAIERAARAAVERALAGAGSVDLLVVDCASVFAQAGRLMGVDGGGPDEGSVDAREALRACLDASWNVTSTVANSAFLPDGHGGRIVYLAPPAGGGEHADAARAGLENLARTLSIEWARHGITSVAIAPGAASATRAATAVASEVAALTAYLASPAGAYFSGCLLDLTGPAAGT